MREPATLCCHQREEKGNPYKDQNLFPSDRQGGGASRGREAHGSYPLCALPRDPWSGVRHSVASSAHGVRKADMNSPYVRRLRLARELVELRKESGLTHEQLAQKTGQSRAQISRLENGHVVDLGDVMMILEACGVIDDRWTAVMTIAREAAERGWARVRPSRPISRPAP